MNNHQDRKKEQKKIVLALLPFWVPMIPPMGIASLKKYLEARGIEVKTVDANVEKEFREIYRGYLEFLRNHIPPGKIGEKNALTLKP